MDNIDGRREGVNFIRRRLTGLWERTSLIMDNMDGLREGANLTRRGVNGLREWVNLASTSLDGWSQWRSELLKRGTGLGQ
jgi:hypothetical protein